jgi:Fe-S-cluster-containing dehydrogenase component
MFGFEFYIDPTRCIGCRSCESACAECETHRGVSMISVDYLDRSESTATTPTVCMHCEEPTCAMVCPADAIKVDENGIVHSSLKPRCIACSNCVMACPFGVPKMQVAREQMMKCDMCFDRTSEGKKPMCATVCPSQALTYVPASSLKRKEKPSNTFRFGKQVVKTKVFMMLPEGTDLLSLDVADYIWEEGQSAPTTKNMINPFYSEAL